jgi:hypothetical protein
MIGGIQNNNEKIKEERNAYHTIIHFHNMKMHALELNQAFWNI